jgi:Protein of unknown function (DUF3572)
MGGTWRMKPEQAEVIAVQALGWLAGNDDLFPAFLSATGASPQDVVTGVQDPAFLSGVLRFVTQDDAWVIAFCDVAELSYDTPLRALMALPGAAPHWT